MVIMEQGLFIFIPYIEFCQPEQIAEIKLVDYLFIPYTF